MNEFNFWNLGEVKVGERKERVYKVVFWLYLNYGIGIDTKIYYLNFRIKKENKI